MKRVMIVDDEDDIRFHLRVIFEIDGFEVLEASTGEEALAAIEITKDLDAVVLDMRMPGMNGLEVVERMRQDGLKVPVIMLSAQAEPETRHRAKTSGATEFITKPFDPEILVDRVRQLAG